MGTILEGKSRDLGPSFWTSNPGQHHGTKTRRGRAVVHCRLHQMVSTRKFATLLDYVSSEWSFDLVGKDVCS